MSHYSHYQQIYWAAAAGGGKILSCCLLIIFPVQTRYLHQQNTDNPLLYFLDQIL